MITSVDDSDRRPFKHRVNYLYRYCDTSNTNFWRQLSVIDENILFDFQLTGFFTDVFFRDSYTPTMFPITSTIQSKT